jgi:hypothetical protein
LIFGGLTGSVTAPLEVVLLVFSHASDEVVLKEISPDEVAERMRFSMQQERLAFTSYYQLFRYASQDAAVSSSSPPPTARSSCSGRSSPASGPTRLATRILLPSAACTRLWLLCVEL